MSTANISLSQPHYIRKLTGKMSSSEQGLEVLKCKSSPFYFIYNYVYIPEIGGVLKYDKSIIHSKMVQTVRSIMKYHRCLLMASRQLGKALDVKTLIPLATGKFKTLHNLTLDDWVLDENHNPIPLVAMTDIMYDRPCYQIKFNNDQQVIADKKHMWCISSDDNVFNFDVIETDMIYNYMQKYNTKFKILYDDSWIYITDIYPTESVPVKCIQVDNPTGLFLCTESKIPTHNSTIAAALLEWSCNFFPRMPATILNANKTFALENLEKVKFIHSNIPDFLRTPLKYRGERKTTMDYVNGSILRVFYPSSTTSPSMLARSLTSPILYGDEAAFIPHMRQA